MRPSIVSLEHRILCTLQQGHNNRLHDLSDVVVSCQMDVNVYQRHPVIQHLATSNHEDQYRTAQTEIRWRLEVTPDGITKQTVVYTEELIYGTDSNQDDIMDSNINLTRCDSMEGNSQPRQFMQQNRHNFRPPRNDENIQRQR
ncbi:hypothetical protein TNCV_1911611 [Trichonephila clavipes]|nr:hypothetical protein TNCV_1911611 [Trichonephila clavipes]